MIGRRGWAALLVSTLAHAGLVAVFVATFAVREVPSGPPPVASIGLTTDSVSREAARTAPPDVRPAPAGSRDTVALGSGGEIGLRPAPRVEPAPEAAASRDLPALDAAKGRDLATHEAVAFSPVGQKQRSASPPGEAARPAPLLTESLPGRWPARPPGPRLEPSAAGIAVRPVRLEARAALAVVGPTPPPVSMAPRRQPDARGAESAKPGWVAAAVPTPVGAGVSRITPDKTRAAPVVPMAAIAERRPAPALSAGVGADPREVIVPKATNEGNHLAPAEAASAVKAAALRPKAAAIEAERPDADVAVARAMTTAAAMPPRPARAATASALEPPTSSAAAGPPAAVAALRQRTGGSRVIAAAPESPPLAPERPDAVHAMATLGWTGGLGEAVDPVSLRAAEAFVSPGLAGGRGPTARDAIDDLLTGLPCARAQATFDPATGSLHLRGHVPDAEAGRRLVGRLETLVGNAIPLDADLRLLPPPQCEALPLVAALGLPQSDAHANDPAVVGPDAFVREETYREGESVRLDLQAPDYPAFLYVDYFDASGAVIHLLPNEHLPTGRLPPDATVRLGGRIEEGAAFEMLVSPPFHKEIAVAYAASEPLYKGTRPLAEPAAPYLHWLHDRIAEAKARSPAFRGEWAYVFINTEPREAP